MRVTITANGYQGLKAEVAEVLENGARVIVNRKGIDLAPRTIYFTWDAIKGGKIEMPETPKTPNVLEAGQSVRVIETGRPGKADGRNRTRKGNPEVFILVTAKRGFWFKPTEIEITKA